VRARLIVCFLAALLAGASAGCDSAGAAPRREGAPAPAPPGFLKGQLHAHTGASEDSETEPAEAAAWYAARGYDFVVFTDHNVVTEIPAPPGLMLLRGVELTQNYATCTPRPEPGDACLLHVNALLVGRHPEPILFPPGEGEPRAELYARAVEVGLALGGLVQLNHPNFHRSADAPTLVALARRGLAFVEVANNAVDSGNEGDARHPSTDAIWDAALARGARVFGTASDDAHHYRDAARVRALGGVAYTGDRGFVMVRAEKRPEAIRAALAAGDFYGSTGVIFDCVDLSREAIVVTARGEVTFEVIGDGAVIHRAAGSALRFEPAKSGAKIVRVRARDAAGRVAFTQPVWI
jgi:hypothetical protein